MTKKTGIGWLAIGDDGEWNLVGWHTAGDSDSPDCDAANLAIERTEDCVIFSLHKVTFELPDPPRVQGKDVAATVGKVEET